MDRLQSAFRVLATSALLVMSTVAFAIDLKSGAPETYVVKKNDTLWDIANMFLDKPWLWPQLWRNNTQLDNPHLIYPGDVLTIKIVDGEPVLTVSRDKKRMVLSPGMSTRQKAQPINTLNWSAIAPFIKQHAFIDEEEYEKTPHLLGNHSGDIQFVSDDLVLSKRLGRAKDQYRVVRKQDTLLNMDGEVLGVQLIHIADATMVEDRAIPQWLVKVSNSKQEARRGDRLLYGKPNLPDVLTLVPAEAQRGFVVGSLHQYSLLGKHDVVVIDKGEEDVTPGTVMGIYLQGPDIIDAETPRYVDDAGVVESVFNDGSTVVQPAMKIGELIVFQTFSKVSYGIITRASESVKRGAIVAAP